METRWASCTRGSCNTFRLAAGAHSMRIAHNGEINTVTGNENWMRAREALISTDVFGTDVEKIFPICGARTAPVSTRFWNCCISAWPATRGADDDPELGSATSRWTRPRRAFYAYHSALMEPMGRTGTRPASSSSTVVGAVLKLPATSRRHIWATDDGLVVIRGRRARHRPGPGGQRMRLPATRPDVPGGHRTGPDHLRWEIKAELARRASLSAVARRGAVPPRRPAAGPTSGCAPRRTASAGAGYTYEELNLLVAPAHRCQALGSMGTDTPIAVLSARPRMLFDYFSSCSPRSPTPRWTPSGRRSSPTCSPPSARTATCSTRPPSPATEILMPQPILRNHESWPSWSTSTPRTRCSLRHALGRHPLPVSGGQGWGRPAPGARRHPRRGVGFIAGARVLI